MLPITALCPTPPPCSPPHRRPHAVYKLSKRRLPPLEPIANGAQYRAIRLWVLLDQLQTANTLAEAHKRTRELTQST
jgi:hypothetical protein